MASPILHPTLANLPPHDPTPEQLAEWLTGGRDVLRDAAGPLRLWDALRAGRTTPPQRRRLLGRLIDGAKTQLGDLARWLADNLRSGTATLDAWWRKFAGISATHNYAGVMAAVGTTDPTPADRKSADDEVRRQLGFLMRFREQLRTGAQSLHNLLPDPNTKKQAVSGQFVARSELYSDAIHGTAESVIRAGMIRAGYDQERRILHSADHCEECLHLASLGWQPAGSLPGIGEGTPCLVRCRCSFQWRHPGSLLVRSSPLLIHP